MGTLIGLRRWSVDSVDELLLAMGASFLELHQWMSWADTMPTRDLMLSVLRDDLAAFDADTGWQYFLYEIESGELVGGAGLTRRGSPDELEVGYWVRSDRTGRGYATDASRMLTTAAFQSSLGINRVRISMDATNHASAAVPRRLGFHFVGESERESSTLGRCQTIAVWEMDRANWIHVPTW